MIKNKIKGSVMLYVLILVNISLIMGISIYNYTITISNNMNVKMFEDDLYRNIYDKGNIVLNALREFNSNGGGYIDVISCPTNVTMSGTNNKTEGIITKMNYDLGDIYCKGDYNGDDFRIYFNTEKTDYSTAFYKLDLLNLKFDTGSSTTELDETNNVALGLDVGTTVNETFNDSDKDNTDDGDIDTLYESKELYGKKSSLTWTFNDDKYIGKIVIYKDVHVASGWGYLKNYWDSGYLKFYNSSGDEFISPVHITGASDGSDNSIMDIVLSGGEMTITIDLGSAGLNDKLHKLELITEDDNTTLDLDELEMYEYKVVTTGGPHRIGEREFNDVDNTIIDFDNKGTGGGDNIDDNMNSDDHIVGSTYTGSNYINYDFGYIDDDVLPRMKIWGHVTNGSYYNIFWNNYKTLNFIDNSPYNNIGGEVENMSNVGTGYIYIDTYNDNLALDTEFELKILKFDKIAYRDENTLLIKKSWDGQISNNNGYIQLSNTGSLSLSNFKTGNEFIFNFKDFDYSIFIKNKLGSLNYSLIAETETGTGVYINPVNDYKTGVYEVLVNHMLMEGEKNFIGEQFVIVGNK